MHFAVYGSAGRGDPRVAGGTALLRASPDKPQERLSSALTGCGRLRLPCGLVADCDLLVMSRTTSVSGVSPRASASLLTWEGLGWLSQVLRGVSPRLTG